MAVISGYNQRPGRYSNKVLQYTPLPIGGTITTDGDYRIHTFNSSTNFTCYEAMDISILIVGGGGGSGFSSNVHLSGGGGGGEVKETTISISQNTHQIIIGNGGPGGTANPPHVDGYRGGSSHFGNYISAAGGYGSIGGAFLEGSWNGANSGDGHTGGAGGKDVLDYSGGGGGDNANGGNGSHYAGGNGGDGTLSQITGNYYGGGGGGVGAGFNGYATVGSYCALL